jgi:y4mF family transcriptional regulator
LIEARLEILFPDRESSMNVKEIGRFIRKERKSQNLRQFELAGAAGVGVRFLVELEQGKATVQLGKVLSVLDALGCTVSVSGPLEMGPAP